MALLFKTIPWPDYDCYFHEINIMNVLLHRRHLGGDLSWQVAEHDENGALEQGGAEHRVGMSGDDGDDDENGDGCEDVWGRAENTGLEYFYGGYITPYHDDIYILFFL